MNSTADKIKTAVARLVDSGAHVSVASSSQFIGKKLGLSERWIQYTHIEIRNKLSELKYKKTPFKERVLFLPHCMRNQKKCKAEYNEDGLQCTECGECKLGRLVKMARERGYRATYIVPGGSMLKAKIAMDKPKAVLGVACFEEVQMAFDALKGTGIGVQAVLLARAGCVNTDVNIEEVREKMDLIDESLKGKKKR